MACALDRAGQEGGAGGDLRKSKAAPASSAFVENAIAFFGTFDKKENPNFVTLLDSIVTMNVIPT